MRRERNRSYTWHTCNPSSTSRRPTCSLSRSWWSLCRREREMAVPAVYCTRRKALTTPAVCIEEVKNKNQPLFQLNGTVSRRNCSSKWTIAIARRTCTYTWRTWSSCLSTLTFGFFRWSFLILLSRKLIILFTLAPRVFLALPWERQSLTVIIIRIGSKSTVSRLNKD